MCHKFYKDIIVVSFLVAMAYFGATIRTPLFSFSWFIVWLFIHLVA